MTRRLGVAPQRGLAVTLFALAACSGDVPVVPLPASCETTAADLRSLQVFEGKTVRGAELACVRLAGSARYVLVPQMLGEDLPYVYQPFLIGTPDAPIASASLEVAPLDLQAGPATAQQRLHDALRRRERGLRATPELKSRAYAEAEVGPAQREFSVLASIDGPLTFARVQATRRYAGAHVLLYVDDRTSAYGDAELAALGALYNDVLYVVDRDAFGDASDVDGNGRIIVLLTPAVNALVRAADCPTFGFVTGYFYGFDLSDIGADSNRGEVFYAMAPDAAGSYSCPHTKADVDALLPATFLHEFQHMISYGHHVIARGLSEEVPWLNEGLSHVAEELGSLHYENKYPPPMGRSEPQQLFPDSATAFVIGDVFNSYQYLSASQQYSIVSCAPGSYCSTPERGASWLFLRWLADVTDDSSLFLKLVQSDLVGTENVAAASSKPFDELFGEFALAIWADSVVGTPRVAPASRLRFAQRNLRRVYSALYDALGPLGGVPRRFPIAPIELVAGQRRRSAMRPGSLQVFQLSVPAGRAEIAISFSADDGRALNDGQRAQLSILRVP